MSFTVRTVTQRAGGGEIVRNTRYEKTQLTVGRGTDCDVQLTDLAVVLRHLELVQSGPLLRVIAAEGVPFELDGGYVENAMVAGIDHISIVIGSHRLDIGPGDAPGNFLVAVERTGPVLDASSKDELAEFSIAGRALSKRGMAWLFALLVLAIGLAWPVGAFLHGGPAAKLKPDQMWLSGSLSVAHQNLKGGCQACHVEAFVSVRDDTCKSCHTTAHDHASPLRMLRAHPNLSFGNRARIAVGGVFGLDAARCSSCHREHEGPKTVLNIKQPFCGDCHRGLAARLPDTKLLDVPDFAGHPEFRPTLGAKRVSLALRPQDDPGLIFSHRQHLAAGGGVARMAQSLKMGTALQCASCHRPDKTGVGYLPVKMERDCGACHALGGIPHGNVARAFAALSRPVTTASSRVRPGEIGAATRAMGHLSPATLFGQGGLCVDCHKLLPAPQPGALPRVAPVRLEQRFLPLGGFDHSQHKFSACADCHATALSERSSDVMLPSIQRCRDCHAQPKAPHPARGVCTECHGFHAPADTPAKRSYTERVITWDRNGRAGTESTGRSRA